MKTKSNYSNLLAICAVLLSALAPAFAGSQPTAFQLAKDGNRFVGEPSRSKVLEIYSDKSIAGLTPSIWHVAYFDPDARSKVVEVKFGAGLKMDVSRPWKLLGGSGKEENVLDLKKFKVDSDGAIKTATTQQLLQPFTLKYTQLWLRRGDDGLSWKVRIWAAKLGKADSIVEIGDIYISPEDGQVIRADLHIDRLN